MTSNPSSGGPLSSSPVSARGISPVHRRSISPGDLSELTSRAARHSPTLSRSFDPHDPQARERQRTMDVDMALQLSLARREPFLPSPVTAFPSGVLASSPFDSVSNNAPDLPFSMRPDNDIIEEHDDLHHTDGRFESQNVGDELPHRPSLADLHQHGADPSVRSGETGHEEPSSLNFGLPSYQANVSQSTFSFTIMEEFATAEKAKLGLSSSLSPKFVLSSSTRGRPKPQVDPSAQSDPSCSTSAPAVEGAQPEGQPDAASQEQSSPRTMRHRKLSQSNAFPRAHRKGIGGKMALFENGAHDASSSFSARLGMALGGHGRVSDPNVAAAPPTGGILNTGHDRPYRFSFYSNSFAATIHARSLSELPAERQTFEQLFSGIQPTTQDGINGADTSLPPPIAIPGKDRPSSSMAFPYQDSAKPNLNVNTIHGNHNPNSNRHSAGGPPEKSGLGGFNTMNEGVNTWWLDVLSPTDEEMKMLSKVYFSFDRTSIVL